MTQSYKYDTSYKNNIKGAESNVLFDCGSSRCIKRLSCNLILKLLVPLESNKKATLDLDFLYYCRNNNLISTFLKFTLANKKLANSDVYKSCQQKLLTAKIEEKKRVTNKLPPL